MCGPRNSDEDFLTLQAVSKNHYSILMHYLNGDVGEGQSVYDEFPSLKEVEG